MRISPHFEIKIAVIGPVSAGKSTLLNGMLVGKYSEVSKSCTTAGVNFFRLNHPPKQTSSLDTDNEAASQCLSSSSSCSSLPPSCCKQFWSLVSDKVDIEDDIHKQISEDNKTLRSQSNVQERVFDIEGIDLVSRSRKDTTIVLVDIPGLNEADSCRKYYDYVESNWQLFDCVILVMDANNGVSTEEQVHLLEFVKKNLNEKKDLPLITLFNKADELNVREYEDIVKEARAKVHLVLDVDPSNTGIVEEIIAGSHLKGENDKNVPLCLPISARDGYVYRLAQAVDKERFQKLEMELLEHIGKQQIGLQRWNKLSHDEKLKEAYETIRDPEVYYAGLISSNFENFLKLLSFCVSGKGTEEMLIASQNVIGMKSLRCAKADLSEKVRVLLERMSAIGDTNTKMLQEVFWESYGNLEESVVSEFNEASTSVAFKVSSLTPLKELIEYHAIALQNNWEEQANLAIQQAKQYLNRNASLYLEKLEKDIENPSNGYILSSMLIMTGNTYFNEHFGTLKMILEHFYVRVLTAGAEKWRFELKDKKWTMSSKSHEEGSSVDLGGVDVSPSSLGHPGHLFWRFCQWMERVNNTASLSELV